MSTDAQSTQPLVTCQYGRAPHALADDCVDVTPFTPTAQDVPALLAEVEALRAEVDRERGKVGDLVREVEALRTELATERQNFADAAQEIARLMLDREQLRAADITRGQGEVWPAGASLPAGSPLPRRVPMQAAFEVGEFPPIVQPAPMTDPALEDRTEGSEP